jgi:hypothetical protein
MYRAPTNKDGPELIVRGRSYFGARLPLLRIQILRANPTREARPGSAYRPFRRR